MPPPAFDRHATLQLEPSGYQLRTKPLLQRWIAGLRKKFTVCCLVLSMMFLSPHHALAVTSGRMGGGSFNSRSSSSGRLAPSRSMGRSTRYYRSSPSITVYTRPSTTRVFYTTANDHYVSGRGFSTSDIVVLTGTGALLAYGFTNNRQRELDRATVSSLTVSMDVPNRDDPSCILNKLRAISERVDTSTVEGVQDLVNEGRLFGYVLFLEAHAQDLTHSQSLSSCSAKIEASFLRIQLRKRTVVLPRLSGTFSGNRLILEAGLTEKLVRCCCLLVVQY